MTTKKIIAAGFALFVSSLVSAVPILDAGNVDNLLGQASLKNSGKATEEAWIESILGSDISYSKLDQGGSYWEAVNGGAAGDYAFKLPSTPTHILIKVGKAGTDNSHYLFENNSALDWAFINLSVLGDDVKLDNIGVISHIGFVGGGTNVTEPASLALLALGLAGLSYTRRKKIR